MIRNPAAEHRTTSGIEIASREIRVTLLATFGMPPRGISMYADELFTALRSTPDLSVQKIDFRALYPRFLFPAEQGSAQNAPDGVLHWAQPRSWRAAGEMAEPVLHLQYWSVVTSLMLSRVLRAARKLGKRVIVTVHNPLPHEPLPVFAYWERALLREADMLIVHTQQGRDLLRGRLGDSADDRISVIPHGIHIRNAQTASAEDYALAGLNPARSYVVLFGNLRGYKGIPTLLRAWRSVCRAVDGVDLVIAGRLWGGDNSRCSRIAARVMGSDRVAEEINGLLRDPVLAPRVILQSGFISESALDALCRIACLAVFPYERMSGQSGAAARAAGWGVPLVVTDIGGLPDLVFDPSHRVRVADAPALAATLARLLASPEMLVAMRDRQLRHSRTFAWDRVAAQHMRLYQALAVGNHVHSDTIAEAHADHEQS